MSDFKLASIVAAVIALGGAQGSAQPYSANRSGDVVQLRDERAQTIVSILPSVGNIAFAIGFHPYFQLTDSPRDAWKLSVGARTHWLLTSNKVPTVAAPRHQPRPELRRAGPHMARKLLDQRLRLSILEIA
jgi:hypothetical protein